MTSTRLQTIGTEFVSNTTEELLKELQTMEEFILAGLLFHVCAAAALALVSAISGMMDTRRGEGHSEAT